VATPIGPFHVRRSAWIASAAERVWREFESFERMKAWYGTGHALTTYEPHVGGMVVTDATSHRGSDASLIFSGRVLVYDPPRELTFEQDWEGHDWRAPSRITLRLTPLNGGTLVELFHHGFDATSHNPGDELNGFESGWDNHHLIRLRDVLEAAPGAH
jgi:uncharacterized protein YndB with AHSA1/START domain